MVQHDVKFLVFRKEEKMLLQRGKLRRAACIQKEVLAKATYLFKYRYVMSFLKDCNDACFQYKSIVK